MTDDPNDKSSPTSAAAALEGYFYQLDVSIWAALDLLLAKKVAHRVVLEPASQEDLEVELVDNEPGAMMAAAQVQGALLVVQAKLRSTGPWKVGELASLLTHGKEREPAAQRLKNPNVQYVLVTSGDIDGVIRDLRISNFGERPKATVLPDTIAAVVPAGSGGRIAILGSSDQERVSWKLRELLEDAFRVPHSRLEECKTALREEALARMRGAGNGVWTREELERVIRDHDGYLASSPVIEAFVKPTNWDDLDRKFHEKHAVIITGASGTGKTTAARVLLDQLCDEVPGIERVYVLHGPQEVRAYSHSGPVIFFIEDPWGRYRLEPGSEPWNEELMSFLPTANGNRWFIVTSRSDVLADSKPSNLSKKWNVSIEVENYGAQERSALFEHRLRDLPTRHQPAAVRYKADALDRLRSPLEIQKYFDALAEGPGEDENQHAFVRRCIASAHRDAIESTVVNQVRSRQGWPWAAVVWGLLKARANQYRLLLPDIQAGLGGKDKELEDGLDPFVNFLLNGRNLRQPESTFGYAHPRVEAGLETAMLEKPGLAARVLRELIDVLIDLDTVRGGDWGRESAANLVQAARRLEGVVLRLSPQAETGLDAWLATRLSFPGEKYINDLTLAAHAGSPKSIPGQVAKWLIQTTRTEFSFGDFWEAEPNSDEWYTLAAADPLTPTICEGFVRYALPNQREWYPDEFSDHIIRLAPNITPAFVEVAASIVTRGADPNADAIAHGALRDLDDFEPIITAAIDFENKNRQETAADREEWLAIINGEVSEDYAQHLGETRSEIGFTADLFLKAYVKAARKRNGWKHIAGHPLVEGLVLAWTITLRDSKEDFAENELLDLAERAFGHRHEDLFWQLAEKHWKPSLAEKLLDRIVAGHADPDIRIESARCLAEHGADLKGRVLADLMPGNPRRLVELALDLREVGKDKEDRPAVEALVSDLLKGVTAPVRQLATQIFSGTEPLPVMEGEALALIRQLDPRNNAELGLEKASLLVAAGVDTTDLITRLIKSEGPDRQREIHVAAAATKLAAQKALWPEVEAALAHRFADVRRAALQALAPRTTGALPPNLLALARDKGSGVRQELLEILRARRAPEHLDALLTLATDEWSPQSVYYGQDNDYPIAQAAAALLAEPPELPQRSFERIIEIATKTDDSAVRLGLLAAMVSNGGAAGITRVCDLAVSRENVQLSIAGSWALFRARDKVDEATAAQLTPEQVLRRGALIAVPMAMTIGTCASDDHVRSVARALSTNADRKVLLVALVVGVSTRNKPLADEIGRLLPNDLVSAIVAAFGDGPKLPRDTLDDLGDVRIVQEIIRRMSLLFEPKPKK